MKLISRHWRKIYRSDPKDWNMPLLEPCTNDELEALCRLLGVPYSGTKSARVVRLLDMADLRVELSEWGEYRSDDFGESHKKAYKIAEQVVSRYKKRELIVMAKRAKIFRGLPKRGLVIGLLQWRDRCRLRGQRFNEELRKATIVQYYLPGIKRHEWEE